MVGELGSGVVKWSWFLLHVLLSLPLAIWLSPVLNDLAVFDWSCPSCELGYVGSPFVRLTLGMGGVWSTSSVNLAVSELLGAQAVFGYGWFGRHSIYSLEQIQTGRKVFLWQGGRSSVLCRLEDLSYSSY